MAIPLPLHVHGSHEGTQGHVAGSWVYVIFSDSGVGSREDREGVGAAAADVLLRVWNARRQCGAAITREDNNDHCVRECDGNQRGGGRRRSRTREVIVVAAVGVVQYAQLQIR